ncbi:MAG: serine peptidase, partial [Marinobacter sp.]|nr:serine peptidase [Marinobacter sp.]
MLKVRNDRELSSGRWGRNVATVGVYLLCLLVPLLLTQTVSARGLPDFTELVENNSSAVVNISTTTEPKAGRNRPHGLPFDERQLEQ